jgi:hypothetical protein
MILCAAAVLEGGYTIGLRHVAAGTPLDLLAQLYMICGSENSVTTANWPLVAVNLTCVCNRRVPEEQSL